MNIRKFLAIIILFILCLNTAFASIWKKEKVSDEIKKENKNLFDNVNRNKLPEASSGAEGNLMSLKDKGRIVTYLSGDKPFLNKTIQESLKNRTLLQKLLGEREAERLIIGNKIIYNIKRNNFLAAKAIINAYANKFEPKEKKQLLKLKDVYITTDNMNYISFKEYYNNLEKTYNNKLDEYQKKYKSKYDDVELNHASHTEIMYIDDVNNGHVETASTIVSLKPMCANCEKAMLNLYKKKDKELAFISVKLPSADQTVDRTYATKETFITKYTLDWSDELTIRGELVPDSWSNIDDNLDDNSTSTLIQPDPNNGYRVGKKLVKKNSYNARDHRIITGTAINKKISVSEKDMNIHISKRKHSQQTITQPEPSDSNKKRKYPLLLPK